MPTTDVMQKIVTAMRAGDWDAAESQARAVLQACPDDAVALRLLGTVCQLTGRLPEAIEHLSAAHALAPDDPDTLVNLGSAHLDAGQLEAARQCFEQLVALDDEAADGHYSLGLVAQRAGQLDTARQHFKRALALDPEAVDAAVNLAVLALRAGTFEACIAHTAQALRVHPAHPQALLAQLKGQIELGQTVAAETTLRASRVALAKQPSLQSHLQALEAQLRHRAGQLDTAAALYESALQLGDTREDTALSLARCLLEAGQATAAVRHLQHWTSGRTGSATVHELLGRALQESGDAAGALRAYQAAAALAPAAVGYLSLQARALSALGRDREADALVATACARAPGVVTPHLLHLERLAASGDLNAALAVCEAFLSRRPGECNMLAARGFLLHALGRSDEGNALIDFDRLVRAQTIAAPPGFPDLAAFNRALAAHVQAHPSLTHLGAASKATQHGRQSGNLLFGERGPFEAFETLLWQQATAYIEAMPRDPDHPFLAGAPPLEGVHCWGVVLERAGYQSPHIHPTGWLSGVYYPSLPGLAGTEQDQAGWLEFGAPPPALCFRPEAPRRRLRPEEGLMVLFPSFLYHRTVPYASDAPRVSVAFDFRPGSSRTAMRR